MKPIDRNDYPGIKFSPPTGDRARDAAAETIDLLGATDRSTRRLAAMVFLQQAGAVAAMRSRDKQQRLSLERLLLVVVEHAAGCDARELFAGARDELLALALPRAVLRIVEKLEDEKCE